MTLQDYYEFLATHGIPKSPNNNGEITLARDDALTAIAILKDSVTGVFGGDVYELENGEHYHLGDTWYTEKSDNNFIAASLNKSHHFIQSYSEPGGIKVRYALIIDD